MDNPIQILNKTTRDLEKKKNSLLREVEQVNGSIDGIKRTIEELNLSALKVAAKRKKNKKNINTSKITLEMVRDAAVKLGKNPPDVSGQRFPPDKGYFTQKHINNMFGKKEYIATTLQYLNDLTAKGILESKKYKKGLQFKYIDPTKLEQDSLKTELQSASENFVRSEPIPGTGNKDRIHVRDKDMEKLLRIAKSQGYVISRLGSDHIRVSSASLKKFVTVSATTNKPYQVNQLESELRKIGVNL